MRYTFQAFEFDRESLVLSENGEVTEIRHNEASVLAVLLENADSVVSKEQLLGKVWQGKVVSDQAVFQNISNLRALFGPDAIKTFPKRGYQWRLAFNVVDAEKAATDNNASPTDKARVATSIHRTRKRPGKALAWALRCVLMISVLTGIYSLSQFGGDRVEVGVIPFLFADNIPTQNLNTASHVHFTEIESTDTGRFLTSHPLEYKTLSQAHRFVLAGEVRHFDNRYYIDFLLKGPHSDWRGQVSGDSPQSVFTGLATHLDQPFVYDFIANLQSPELKQANLSIAHQQQPRDPIILRHLVQSYIDTDELDKAMVMADKLLLLASELDNAQYQGHALLLQSAILTQKSLFDLSEQKLSMAIDQFEGINDKRRHADAMEKQSWLAHQRRDYPGIKASLLKSAQLAFEAGDIPRELHALTYLSVMALKRGNHDDKYAYLQLAERKMHDYQLPSYHFAKIPFHHAIYSKTPEAKEPHFKQVLAYTSVIPDHWVAQSSRLQLLELYLANDRLDEATSLVQSTEVDNAANNFLKTRLALKTNDHRAFATYAQRTFEQAQLGGHRRLSLDVALLLYQHSEPADNREFYAQYIREKSTKYWLIENKARLASLNVIDELADVDG